VIRRRTETFSRRERPFVYVVERKGRSPRSVHRLHAGKPAHALRSRSIIIFRRTDDAVCRSIAAANAIPDTPSTQEGSGTETVAVNVALE
jgi:hypothetical protein